MEVINCIFCSHDKGAIVIEENGYQGKKCSSCALIYISPRPLQDKVLDLYGHSNAHVSPASHMQGGFLKRLYAKHIISLIKKYKKEGSLLEIGSGGGYFLDEARKQGFTPYAIELNPVQCSFIQEKLSIACDKNALSKESYGQMKFDIIFHSDVISHFYDPIKEFKTMHDKLNPDGIIVFETGNIADINKKYFNYFSCFQYPDHLFFFGEETLKKLLDITHFTLKNIHRYSILPQLSFMKIIGKYKKELPANKNSSTLLLTKKRSSFFKDFLMKVYYYGLYVMRYRLGKCIYKYQRPQTLIVVAQK